MPEYDFTVRVQCASRALAERVMSERIDHDEGYGFEYDIFLLPSTDPVVRAEKQLARVADQLMAVQIAVGTERASHQGLADVADANAHLKDLEPVIEALPYGSERAFLLGELLRLRTVVLYYLGFDLETTPKLTFKRETDDNDR